MPDGITMAQLLDEAASGVMQTPSTTPAPNNTTATNTMPAGTELPTAGTTTPADGTNNTNNGTEAPAGGTETPAEGNKPAATETDPEPEDTKNKPNPMKDLRDNYNSEKKARQRIEDAMQRYTEGDYKFNIREFKDENGKVDYDKFIEAMDAQDTEARAKTNNITPELQAAIDRIEREKKEIAKKEIEASMNRSVADMQIELNLNRKDIDTFFKDALTVNHNPYQWLAMGGNLQDLYYLIYKDRIVKDAVNKAVEEAKTSWSKANSAVPPTTNPAAQNTQALSDGKMSLKDFIDGLNAQ